MILMKNIRYDMLPLQSTVSGMNCRTGVVKSEKDGTYYAIILVPFLAEEAAEVFIEGNK